LADRIDDRSSLKDLDGVRVAVEEPIPVGLSRDALKALIEAQLRAARIKVLGMGDFPTGDPHLRLTLTVADRSGLVAAAVQLDFVQIVFLRRNPQVTFNRAQTWKADATLIAVPPPALPDAVAGELTRQVTQFIDDYRAVNG
jgi:hypothetical protein